jgi:CBS-domain-containing membrane protein
MNTTVKDLIIPLEQFPHVQSEAPVHEAVGLLFSHVNGTGRLQYDELLVISADNQYVGRLTVRGILTCYFPTLFATGDKQIFAGKKEKFSDLAILMEDSFQGECKRQGALPVRDYMAPPLKSIKAGLHPLHAAEIMMTENETCLPVVEDGILIGLVRLIDIFHTLAGSCSL